MSRIERSVVVICALGLFVALSRSVFAQCSNQICEWSRGSVRCVVSAGSEKNCWSDGEDCQEVPCPSAATLGSRLCDRRDSTSIVGLKTAWLVSQGRQSGTVLTFAKRFDARLPSLRRPLMSQDSRTGTSSVVLGIRLPHIGWDD